MKNRFIGIFMIITLFVPLCFASNIGSLYDCPSMMLYSPNRYTYESLCKNASTFGVSAEDCKSFYNEHYAKPNLEYKRGQCKLSNQKYIEGKYNSTNCSIDFITSPYPKINGHGYGGSNNSELEGAKCIDNLYKELKVKYPNISP